MFWKFKFVCIQITIFITRICKFNSLHRQNLFHGYSLHLFVTSPFRSWMVLLCEIMAKVLLLSELNTLILWLVDFKCSLYKPRPPMRSTKIFNLWNCNTNSAIHQYKWLQRHVEINSLLSWAETILLCSRINSNFKFSSAAKCTINICRPERNFHCHWFQDTTFCFMEPVQWLV
jgi:hypothetical protein